MTQENIEKIREGLRQLDEATNGIQGLSVFALVMPHGTRGQWLSAIDDNSHF